MTVMWHDAGNSYPTKVQYKELDAHTWQQATGSEKRLLDSSVIIHQVELTNLSPNTDYLFRINEEKLYRFKTLPKSLDERSLKIAIGGDAYFHKASFTKMNTQVASKSPDFVILAGDLAYTEGLRNALKTRYWKVERWEQFFEMWTKTMITKEGRIIPIVPVIGNHDVREGFDNPHKQDVIFYQVFPFPNPGYSYRTFSIGEDTTFYLLDSGHSYPVGGRQTEWLKGALKKSRNAKYNIPIYHIAAYPTVTSFTHSAAKDIRKFWVPLFEKYGVKISMEHDCHTFKRTFPLREGMVDRNGGILYLGDGCWSVPPEKPQRHWYLYKSSQINCYWLLKMGPEKTKIKALDMQGDVLDSLEITATS